MSDNMEKVSQQTLSKKVNEVSKHISEKQIPTLVTMDDQPALVILPYETYQQLLDAREESLRIVYERIQKRVIDNSEILKGLDSVKLVREMRNNR